MANKFANIALGALGFGLCKTAISIAYITAMGSVSSSVGFVSELDFMFVMNAASFITACVIVVLVRVGKLRPGSLSQVPAVIALLAGFFLSATGVLEGLSLVLTTVLYGVLCGFALTVLNAVWLEVFVAEAEPTCGVYQIVGGLVVQCLLVSLLPLLGAPVASVLSIVAVLVSAYLLVRCRRGLVIPDEILMRPANRSERFTFVQACLCLFVLVGVVGILHTTVLGSQLESIVGDVNMWMPLVVATLITALLAGLTMRHPNPTVVYKACLPVMLAVLTLLPFFGEVLGGVAGLVMITCYDVCGMVFLFFIVDQARALHVPSYVLSAVYLGGSGLFLVVGLSIGGVLGVLSADYGLSLATLLAFAAIYPLALALVVALRRVRPKEVALAAAEQDMGGATRTDVGVSADGGSSDTSVSFVSEDMWNASAISRANDLHMDGASSAGDTLRKDAVSAIPTTTSTIDDALSAGIGAMTVQFDLTPREREILGYLARGRSAKFIAETLFISENTTWTHIKRVYAKTGVHSKQELMSVVEQQGNVR